MPGLQGKPGRNMKKKFKEKRGAEQAAQRSDSITGSQADSMATCIIQSRFLGGGGRGLLTQKPPPASF